MDIRHIRTAAALAAAGLVLAAAGPAGAEPKTSTPAKKGCEVQLKGPGAGQSIVYPDGYSFSVQDESTGKTHTYTCNDGTWTETVSLTASPGGVAGPLGAFQVLNSGTAQIGMTSDLANARVLRQIMEEIGISES